MKSSMPFHINNLTPSENTAEERILHLELKCPMSHSLSSLQVIVYVNLSRLRHKLLKLFILQREYGIIIKLDVVSCRLSPSSWFLVFWEGLSHIMWTDGNLTDAKAIIFVEYWKEDFRFSHSGKLFIFWRKSQFHFWLVSFASILVKYWHCVYSWITERDKVWQSKHGQAFYDHRRCQLCRITVTYKLWASFWSCSCKKLKQACREFKQKEIRFQRKISITL